MDAAPMTVEEFTTRAPRDAIVEAACSFRESAGGRPIDVEVDGRRCSFGLAPDAAVSLHVRIHDGTVTFEADLSRDVVKKARDSVERRLLLGDAYHANTYTVSEYYERSPAMRDLGLLLTLLGGAAFVAAPFVGGFGSLAASNAFCFNFDSKPCPHEDTTPFVVASIVLGVGGATVFGVGLGMFYAGRAKVAVTGLIAPSGAGVRFTF